MVIKMTEEIESPTIKVETGNKLPVGEIMLGGAAILGVGFVGYTFLKYFTSAESAIEAQYRLLVEDILAEEKQFTLANEQAGIMGYTAAQQQILKGKQEQLAPVEEQLFAHAQSLGITIVECVTVVVAGIVVTAVIKTWGKSIGDKVNAKIKSWWNTNNQAMDYAFKGSNGVFHLLSEATVQATAQRSLAQASAIHTQMTQYFTQVTTPIINAQITNYAARLATMQAGTAQYALISQLRVMAQFQVSSVTGIGVRMLPYFVPI